MTEPTPQQQLDAMSAALKGPATNPNPTTPTEARARLVDLTADKQWSEDFTAGRVEARREFATLTEMAAQADDRLENALAGKADAQLLEVTNAENPLTSRDIGTAINDLREAGLRDETIREIFDGVKMPAEIRRRCEQLKAKKLGDAEWTKRLLAGDHEAKRELTLISAVLSAEVAE
jgi:hypothetical protein